MLKTSSNKKAQHIIEYCVLICLVALGIILMRNYVYRSVFAHLKMWEDEVDTANRPLEGGHCLGLGGTPQSDGDISFCKFSGATCPTGWRQYLNWSTNQGGNTCTCDEGRYKLTGHPWSNTVTECIWCLSPITTICYSNIIEIGCIERSSSVSAKIWIQIWHVDANDIPDYLFYAGSREVLKNGGCDENNASIGATLGCWNGYTNTYATKNINTWLPLWGIGLCRVPIGVWCKVFWKECPDASCTGGTYKTFHLMLTS